MSQATKAVIAALVLSGIAAGGAARAGSAAAPSAPLAKEIRQAGLAAGLPAFAKLDPDSPAHRQAAGALAARLPAGFTAAAAGAREKLKTARDAASPEVLRWLKQRTAQLEGAARDKKMSALALSKALGDLDVYAIYGASAEHEIVRIGQSLGATADAAAAVKSKFSPLELERSAGDRKKALDNAYDRSAYQGDAGDVAVAAGQPGRSNARVLPSSPRAPSLQGPSIPVPAAAAPAWRSGWKSIVVYGGLAVVTVAAVAGAVVIATPVAFVAAGAVAVAAITGGALWHHGQAADKEWTYSKSFREISNLAQAIRARNAGALDDMRQTAEARRQRMEDRIAAAEAVGAKTVADATNDPLAKAATLAGFDGLVIVRTALNGNELSEEPGRRVGGLTPQAWKDAIRGAQTAGQQRPERAREGELARVLKDFHGELSREKAEAGRFDALLGEFQKTVPLVFGGNLKDQAKTAKAEIQRFKDSEISVEGGIHEAEDSAMRKRVSDRIYGQDQQPEFIKRRDHHDSLTGLAEGPLKSAVGLARSVDKDLQEMISQRNTETAMLAMAVMNEHVPVTKCERDSDGGQSCHTEYEDHSGTYKMMAAVAGSAAQAAAHKAQGEIDALRGQVSQLASNKTLKSEGLVAALPLTAGPNVSAGGGGLLDMFIPGFASLLMTGFNAGSASDARAKFGPVKGALESVNGVIKERQAGEGRWLDGQIDQDLQRQMAAPA
ncbi:MAG: hypothetical protein NTY77_11945 [Elusimicrobia bacterium]|nr:hypothetical protein [Elusimicrobiota bacterium]